MSLIEDELKKLVNYRVESRFCGGCKYRKEVENPHVDRSWFTVCTVCNLKTFDVQDNGTCDKWEKRDPPKS